MTQVTRFYPLLTGYSRYDKTLSTRGHGAGEIITAPILAYLIETRQGRILYDVGCDFGKIADPTLKDAYYADFPFGPPEMDEEQRVVSYLAKLGLGPRDIDVVFCGHLHFDHAGGLCDFPGCEVHVHARELEAARNLTDEAYFADDLDVDVRWRLQPSEYHPLPGITAIETPGHTAGHMSMLVTLPKGRPILLTGDAADLQENLVSEIPPGLCCNTESALSSIRKLKRIAEQENALLWPNHDLHFWQQQKTFPAFYS
ncbi:N-acyl homoserine lactonase family protein [Mangrovitalea sediminis]|uniref:N-acyl homoserine lactonase family protein n=1 Tax=Mangrovitalea sediminis TaxID=1982043 RepID=UPI000BE51192|nr:N-acyl homoserine lactonase family protein [Mangrovitalea sediminis]